MERNHRNNRDSGIVRYLLILRGIRVFLIGLVSLIISDMFLLNGWLKSFFVKANTSSVSPFSTDGQSNWVLIIITILGIILLTWIIHRARELKIPKEGKEKKETEEK